MTPQKVRARVDNLSVMKSWLPSRHRAYPVIAMLAGIIAVARCASIVRVYNHTTDELAHIAGAVGLYESGRNIYMVEHPTLQRLVVGAALKCTGVEYRPARGLKEVQSRPDANLAGADIVFRGKVDYWTVLATARRANLVFLAALLLYIYLMGRYLANSLVGMLACAFASVDPNILGHAALVTTDIPAAAGFLLAAHSGLRFITKPTGRRAVWFGVGVGIACSCKFTCVLVVPGVFAVAVVRWSLKWKRRSGEEARPNIEHSTSNIEHRGGRTYGSWVVRWIGVAAISFATLWATYLFNLGKLQDQHLFITEKTWTKIPDSVKRMTLPMPSMPLGLMFMGALGKTGFPCYLNGHITLTGHLRYFPEAIALKTPSAFVIAFVIAAIFWMLNMRRRPIIMACLILPPSLLLLTAMTGKLQIGIRHALPVLPFLYLFVALHLARGAGSLLLVALLALAAVQTARIHPDYLPYFNALAGGPENGWKYLADSNIDWGQDVSRLAHYLKSTGRKDYTIKVSGVRVADLVAWLGLDPASREVDPVQLKLKPHGLLALGVNARVRLEGAKRTEDGELILGPDWSWATKYPVIKMVGQSIWIYDLDATPGN